MKVNMLLCAEGVIRDVETNTISVFSILESLNARSFPIAIQRLAILYILERDETEPETVTLQIKLSNNDEQLTENTVESPFSGLLRNRTIINLNGLVITNPGKLIISLVYGEDELASYTIAVNSREPATATQQGTDEPRAAE